MGEKVVVLQKQTWQQRLQQVLYMLARPWELATRKQLQTLIAIGGNLAQGDNIAEAAFTFVQQVAHHTKFPRVQLLQAKGESLEVAATVNLTDGMMVGVRELRQEGSPWQWVMRHHKTFISSQMVALPLLAGERLLGILAAYPQVRGRVRADQVLLLQMIATQAVPWLLSAEAQAEALEHQARLQRVLHCLHRLAGSLSAAQGGIPGAVQLTAETVARLFAPATVVVHTGEGVHWFEANSSEDGPGFVGNVVVGADGSHALCLPLTMDTRELGHLELYLHGERRQLGPGDMGLLQTMAGLVAFALEAVGVARQSKQGADGQIEQAYMSTLEALSKALEMRDYETEGHSRRVVQYTVSLARGLKVPDSHLTPIVRGALLHDIGKIGIPDSVLRKPGPLNDEEWAIMKEHPRIGYNLLHQIDFLQDAMPILLHHHERYDGSGYPMGLQAEAIPLGARIFAVADAYDAITSDRPYRKGRSHQEALNEIMRCVGSHFDPSVVHALLTLDADELVGIRAGKLLSLR